MIVTRGKSFRWADVETSKIILSKILSSNNDSNKPGPFRHEKTKKKRGSYKGGPINMGVASIKFDSD